MVGIMESLEVGVGGKGDDGLSWDGGIELEELADGIWTGFPPPYMLLELFIRVSCLEFIEF